MAHQLFSLPRPTAISSNLTLVVGAKVGFFLTGTSTPTNTYQDSALTTPHANPVVADSAARLPAIYLDPSIVYRITFTDSADVEIYPAIDPANDQVLSQAIIGGYLYPRTAAEIAAGVTPTNYQYRPGRVRRYGSTLNSATIQLALNANSGDSIYLEADETHTVTTALTVPANTNILVDGDGTAVIDASTATLSGVGLIVCRGSVSASLGGGLTGTVSAGALVIPFVNSGHGLAAGDLIVIHNTTAASWNADNANYRQGEFHVVKSVSGANVTVSWAMIDTYASTCVVYKVTSTSTRIVGNIEIRGNTGDTANLPTVYIQYGRGTHVEGLMFKNTTASCLEHSNSFMPTVRNVETGKYLTDAGSIQATGVIFSGCQYAHAIDCTLVSDRHGASTGGGGLVVDRFNVFEKCAIASRTAAAADFHGGAEFCSYVRCHIDGAANLSGASNKLIGCHVYQHATVTSLVNFEAAKSFEQLIDDCDFYMRGAGTLYVLDANASTDINANTTVGGTLKFSRCRVHDDTSANQSYVFVRNNGSTASLRIEVSDSEFIKSNASFYGNVLSVSVVSGSDFEKVSYLGNIHKGTGFGTVTGVGRLYVDGDLGAGNAASASPGFGGAFFDPSDFYFQKTLDLTTPATSFNILIIGTGNSFLPLSVAGRTDTIITATTGDFWAVGVSANNRRADDGVCSTAASSSQHAKNAKLRFINSSELANRMVDASEALALLSIATNADNAAAGSNIGGASQSITVRVAGRMIGNIQDAP